MDETEEQKPAETPGDRSRIPGGRVNPQGRRHDDDDNEDDEAGFEFKVPGFRAWGGRAELQIILPVLKWAVVGILALWGALELLRNQ